MSFRALLIYPRTSRDENGAGNVNVDNVDRILVPYGLLTIAAHLRAHDIDAEVINLSTFTWPQAVAAIRARPADLIGLSCYTHNRHAAADLAAQIKALFPTSHVTCGGPHVSAVPLEWLGHYPAFDSVVIGEGEATALDLATRLRDGRPAHDIPGTAWRCDGLPSLGPPRPFITDLDSIGKPWEHFDYGIPVTSRGCPGQCTFCSSPRLWGRKIRFRSADSVLEEMEGLVARRGYGFLAVKDDTFTAHKRRAVAICRGIVERGLEFRWSCDTRVDAVGPEILAAMRRAGCVMVSFGIESASPEILRNIRKRTDLSQALQATAAARELGLDVRFYLMIGNRGETPATVRQTVEFVEKARPTHFKYTPLSVYPGTEEFELARKGGTIGAEDYFAQTAPGAFCVHMGENSPGMVRILEQLQDRMGGRPRAYAPYTTVEREQILARHPDMLRSYLDLAVDYCEQRRLDDAEQVLDRAAQAMGRETPQLTHHLACVAFAKGDMAAARDRFQRALHGHPTSRSLRCDVAALSAAGKMNAQQHAAMAAQLFANLRSNTFTAGQPALPMPLGPCESRRDRPPAAVHVG